MIKDQVHANMNNHSKIKQAERQVEGNQEI